MTEKNLKVEMHYLVQYVYEQNKYYLFFAAIERHDNIVSLI